MFVAPDETHFRRVSRALADGEVVPLLGAGVNLCSRPANEKFRRGKYLPDGGELAVHLARRFNYPKDEVVELLRVSQYAVLEEGAGPLYKELHQLFDANYPITELHRFLATASRRLRRKGYLSPLPLIITTNYDDALERAFHRVGEPFDLVSYIADGENGGKFAHRDPSNALRIIDRPNEYAALDPSERTVILKIHGAIDRLDPDRDSYVITEDHYIDYLARADISNLIPVTLAAKMRRSHFLFLGYGLRDWNLRVILNRLWGEQKFSWRSWAVQLKFHPTDAKLWERRGVDIRQAELDWYVRQLKHYVRQIPPQGGDS